MLTVVSLLTSVNNRDDSLNTLFKTDENFSSVFLYKNEPNAAQYYLTNVQTKSADVYTER